VNPLCATHHPASSLSQKQVYPNAQPSFGILRSHPATNSACLQDLESVSLIPYYDW
jgi:hypothetical protein